jgi:hypothetical protein
MLRLVLTYVHCRVLRGLEPPANRLLVRVIIFRLDFLVRKSVHAGRA